MTGAAKIWRYGSKLARIDDETRLGEGIQTRTIFNAPDVYQIDLKSNHVFSERDSNAGGEPLIPIIIKGMPESAKGLEFGRELEYFNSKGAVRLKDTRIGDAECAVYSLSIEGTSMVLYIDLKRRAPRELSLSNPQSAFTIHYLKYDLGQPLDARLFYPPEGAPFAEIRAGPAVFSTPFDDEPKDPPSFGFKNALTGNGNGSLGCWRVPSLIYFFRSKGVTGNVLMKHIAELQSKYNGTQLCFFPVPLKDEDVPDIKRSVLEIQTRNNVRFSFFENSSPLRGGSVKSVATLYDRQGNAQTLSIDTPEDREALDMTTEAVLNDGTADSSVTQGDMLGQLKRNHAEISFEAESNQIGTLLAEQKWTALDQYFSALRSSRKKGLHGSWDLQSAYQALDWGLNNDAAFEERLALLQRWRSANPASVSARAALGRLWTRFAWRGRGIGAYASLTQTQMAVFSQRLSNARQELEAAMALKEQCPEVYSKLIETSMGEGRDRNEVEKIFRKGQAVEPTYQYSYHAFAHYLQPKWGGKPGELEEFIARVVKENIGGVGLEMAGRAVLILKDEPDYGRVGELFFQKTKIPWDTIRKSFEFILARYPANINENHMAFLACATGDRDTARKAFAHIGDNYFVNIWGNRVVFERSRRWANGANLAPANCEEEIKALRRSSFPCLKFKNPDDRNECFGLAPTRAGVRGDFIKRCDTKPSFNEFMAELLVSKAAQPIGYRGEPRNQTTEDSRADDSSGNNQRTQVSSPDQVTCEMGIETIRRFAKGCLALANFEERRRCFDNIEANSPKGIPAGCQMGTMEHDIHRQEKEMYPTQPSALK